MDNRSKRQKLEAMANQSESPQEAEIARRKLEEMGEPDWVEVFQGLTVFKDSKLYRWNYIESRYEEYTFPTPSGVSFNMGSSINIVFTMYYGTSTKK